jgi:hypothetical protein
MALFDQLLAQGEDWADAEQTVAEHLRIERSTCRRWRARWRAGERGWFGPRHHEPRKPRRSWISNDTPPDPAELLAALELLLR